MKSLKLIIIILPFFLALNLKAQMLIDGDTLFGNEWINYDQEYFKISVAEDGFYKIDYQELSNAGVFSGTTIPQGANFQLFNMGKEVPIYVNDQGTFGNGDFLEFYGKKNRGQMDEHIFMEKAYHTNPEYSIFTDTSAYFLTWNTSTSNLHYAETPNDLNSLPASETYFMHEEVKMYKNVWFAGKQYGGTSSVSCAFDIGEGWAGPWKTSQTINFSTPGFYSSGSSASVDVRYRTKSGGHNFVLEVDGTTCIDTTFSDYSVSANSGNFPASALANTTAVSMSANGAGSDEFAVSTIKMKYPRTFNFGNTATFSFTANPSNTKKYFEITGFNSGGIAPVLYDKTNQLRIETELDGNLVKVTIPPSSSSRDLILVSANDYKNVPSILERDFINYDITAGNYLIVSHPFLFDDGQGNNFVQDYADYRSSPIGGNFNSVIVDIYQIFDQFGYGIRGHEISVRNFTHYAIDSWDSEYLFMLGKGVNFYAMRLQSNTWNEFYRLPAFGHPQSDHLFAASNTSNQPEIPVGRLSAITPEHVDIYLRKVIAYEQNISLPQTIEDKAWMKNIIHLGGGSPDIQTTIKNRLQQAEAIIEDVQFGANVHSFFKTSSDVVTEAPTEQIENLINEGAAMVTFFGHSAPSTLDFDLQDPSYYNNGGKYPIVYTIGCHASRMFEFNGTLAEQWILIEDKGAVAFLGATWETTLSNLAEYADYFYGNMGNDNYGERIGDMINGTIEDLGTNSTFSYAEQLKQVMVLHGDPALKVYSHEGPDYLVDETSVNLQPSLINSQMEDFDVNITFTNIGAAVQDSLTIRVDHGLPSGDVIHVKSFKARSPRFEEDLVINIPLPERDVVGFNKLIFTIDATDTIAELPAPIAEMNNSYEHNFYIVANDAFPVYPYEYSITNNPNQVLKASTANAFANEAKYFLEIDTSGNYNSPLKVETTITTGGGVVEWQPTLPYLDNTVYYWRISIDSTETTGFGFNWHESSFLYKESSPSGWNQSHYYQMKKENEFSGLELPSSTRKLSFDAAINELRVQNGSFPLIGEGDLTPVLNGGVLQLYKKCTPAGIDIAIIDPDSFEPWINPGGGDYGSFNCKNYDFLTYPYKTSTVAQREDLINFLDNVVPSGSYVVLFTTQRTTTDYQPELWAMDSVDNIYQRNIFQLLEEQGATKVRQLETKGSVPYIFVYKKDDPTFLEDQNYMTENVAENDSSLIETILFIESPVTKGAIQSTVIGPAKAWQSLVWNMEDFDAGIDVVDLKIYGLNIDQNETLLHESISVFDTTLNHIDAQEYPYLRLEFASKDSIDKSTAHLDFWRVLYDPVPEAALRPDLYVSFQSDTIQQGEDLIFDIAVENISEVDMDSLLVHYTVIDQNNTTVLSTSRMAPL